MQDDPWKLQTPSQTSENDVWRDEAALPRRLFSSSAQPGSPITSVEAWARADDNPVGSYYGLRKGYRGRFANYVRRCSSNWVWSSSSTVRATTAGGPSSL